MNVLLVVRWPVGGIRTYLKYVYEEILKRNYKCTFVIVDEPETGVLRDDLSKHGAKWVVLPKNQSNFFYAKNILKILREGDYDLVHAQGFTSGVLALLPSRLTNTPIILTPHDILLNEQFVGVKGVVKRIVLSFLFNRCSLIQCVSNDAKKNLHQMLPRLSEKKSIVILNGINEEVFFSAKALNLHHELGIDEETMIIGFFGRFMGPKGFRYVVDAIEILKADNRLNRPFVVITLGQEGFFREEVCDINKRGLQDCFRHLPYSPNIAGTMKATDVVLMPSVWEACGLLAMEAMVAGVPIITSDCIGLREVTKDTPAIKIPMRDGAALANAICQIDSKKKENFTKFSNEAANKFSVKHTIDGVDQMYKNLVI